MQKSIHCKLTCGCHYGGRFVRGCGEYLQAQDGCNGIRRFIRERNCHGIRVLRSPVSGLWVGSASKYALLTLPFTPVRSKWPAGHLNK